MDASASEELRLPEHNITILGAFNPKIVRPDWAVRNLPIPNPECEILFPSGPLEGPVFYRSGPLLWFTTHDRLIAYCNDPAVTAPFAAGVLMKLPETPLKAAGVNFEFTRPLAELRCRAWMVSQEEGAVDVLGAPLLRRRLEQTVLRPDDVQLKVSVRNSSGSDTAVVMFNFHKAPTGADEKLRAEKMREHVLKAAQYQADAQRILGRL